MALLPNALYVDIVPLKKAEAESIYLDTCEV